jgi:hypothetical protein
MLGMPNICFKESYAMIQKRKAAQTFFDLSVCLVVIIILRLYNYVNFF